MSLSQMSGGKNTDKFIHGLVINRALNNLTFALTTLKRTICRLLDMVVAHRSLSSFLTTVVHSAQTVIQSNCNVIVGYCGYCKTCSHWGTLTPAFSSVKIECELECELSPQPPLTYLNATFHQFTKSTHPLKKTK